MQDKIYICGNCGCEISEYRYKHGDKLCQSCFKIIYSTGKDSEQDILGYYTEVDYGEY